jgi:hypothetical protein
MGSQRQIPLKVVRTHTWFKELLADMLAKSVLRMLPVAMHLIPVLNIAGLGLWHVFMQSALLCGASKDARVRHREENNSDQNHAT